MKVVMNPALTEFTHKLETYLNRDEELRRRLNGFKTFSGIPDGHHLRARQEGVSACVRAVRCYPFGGTSLLASGAVIGLSIHDDREAARFVISLSEGKFSVKNDNWTNPHLTMELSKELFKKTILGRHRWVWVLGMDEVTITFSRHLPHSDWITILEILVSMQELVEFDPELMTAIEGL
jgi:hypothetical protein